MPAADVRRRRPRFALLLCFALALPWLAGCRPGADDAASQAARSAAAKRPVDAIYLLRDRLLARDGAGFARVAVPPALHARLEAAWRSGRSRWPLDELPLDAKIPAMLAALQAPDAHATLMATFRNQFAGADGDIDQAVKTLVVFGRSYVQENADYTADERSHVDQAIVAMGTWALAAPLSDPARADRFFTALAQAASRSGIDGNRAQAALSRLGMTEGLDRLSRFLAVLQDQLRLQYGLDFDAALRSVQVELQQQTGDHARLRLRYRLAGTDIDAIVPAVRIDGHWYLADFIERARRSLAAPAAAKP